MNSLHRKPIVEIAPHAVEDISNHLIVATRRAGGTRQPGSQSDRPRHAPQALSTATQIMSEDLEDPLDGLGIA